MRLLLKIVHIPKFERDIEISVRYICEKENLVMRQKMVE